MGGSWSTTRYSTSAGWAGVVVGVMALLLAGTLYGLASYRFTMRSIDSKLAELQEAEALKTIVLSIEQKTQAALLKSESLLTKVLMNEGSEVRNTSWFKRFKDYRDSTAAAKEDFAERYSVTSIPETRLVKVEFTYSDPRACQTIVKEMCAQHILDEADRIFNEGQRQSQQLNALKNLARSQLTGRMTTRPSRPPATRPGANSAA